MADGRADDPHAAIAVQLAGAGFLAAADEAGQFIARAGDDPALLASLVRRRLAGEPLAWITGRAMFGATEVRVAPGVYVPRPHSEALARRAAARLPAAGVAVDLCTGAGAIARALALRQPGARVLGSDLDPAAVACARANGVDAYCGDLFMPLPGDLAGRVDVVVAVAPYVPTPALGLLPSDTLVFESPLAYDGGPDGLDLVRRIVEDSPRFLGAGGALLLELGGEQARIVAPDLDRAGFVDVVVLTDEEDDVRGIEATRA